MKKAWFVFIFSNISLAGEEPLSPDLYMDNSDFESHNEALKHKNGQETINALKSIIPPNNESLIHVSFEPVCGLLSSCTASNLKLSGPGNYFQTYENSSSGYIVKNYNNILYGAYRWNITLNQNTNEQKECTGEVYIHDEHRNITIRVFDSNCQDAGTTQF